MEAEIDEKWSRCKRALIQAVKEYLGLGNREKRKDWFDSECADITNRKNTTYKLALEKHSTRSAKEAYRKLRREEKHVHRRRRENGKLLTSKKWIAYNR